MYQARAAAKRAELMQSIISKVLQAWYKQSCSSNSSYECHVQLEENLGQTMRATIIELILATDMKQHFALLSRLQACALLDLLSLLEARIWACRGIWAPNRWKTRQAFCQLCSHYAWKQQHTETYPYAALAVVLGATSC